MSIATNGGKIVFVPVVIGNYCCAPGSMLLETYGRNAAEVALVRRTYDQVGIRQRLPVNARRLRYHPDIGYC